MNKIISSQTTATSFLPVINGYIDPKVFQEILKIGQMVIADSDDEHILRSYLQLLCNIFGFDLTAIFVFENHSFSIIAGYPDKIKNKKTLKAIFKKVGDTASAQYLKFNSENRISDCSELGLQDDKVQKISIPLKYRNETIGTIYGENSSSGVLYNQRKHRLLEITACLIAPVAARSKYSERKPGTGQELDLRKNFDFRAIIGHHPKIIKVLDIISLVARTDATVLIHGESGTGKELIAHAIHFNSKRNEKPFIPINCGAIPESLLESELFGYEKGAFTGAVKNKIGWFEYADGSTLFLDEVHEMSPALQIKLLRVLQSGSFNRLGSREMRTSNVRIIAATTRNLQELIQVNKFKEELFFRLNVVDLYLPKLSERACDIPLLANHFLKIFSLKYKKNDLTISPAVLNILSNYPFPGNVRELENIIERAVVLCVGDEITENNLPEYIFINQSAESIGKQGNFKSAKQNLIEEFEKKYILDCLQVCNGNISRAAALAGLHFANFYNKMKKYKIEKTFKSDKIYID